RAWLANARTIRPVPCTARRHGAARQPGPDGLSVLLAVEVAAHGADRLSHRWCHRTRGGYGRARHRHHLGCGPAHLGGEHYDLGADGAIAFQPLARIDRDGYRSWAAEWIEGRLLHEGVAVGPDEKAAVWSALG